MSLLIKQMRETILNLLAAEEAGEDIEAKIFKKTLNCTIRIWGDYQYPTFISEAAKVEADKLGIDLFENRWKDQPKFDLGRKIFHLEHKYPVNDMILDMKENPDNIESIMDSYSMGWILKDEDRRLKSHNREDHDALYEEANIRLIRK